VASRNKNDHFVSVIGSVHNLRSTSKHNHLSTVMSKDVPPVEVVPCGAAGDGHDDAEGASSSSVTSVMIFSPKILFGGKMNLIPNRCIIIATATTLSALYLSFTNDCSQAS
jgi:hypothetical protein